MSVDFPFFKKEKKQRKPQFVFIQIVFLILFCLLCFYFVRAFFGLSSFENYSKEQLYRQYLRSSQTEKSSLMTEWYRQSLRHSSEFGYIEAVASWGPGSLESVQLLSDLKQMNTGGLRGLGLVSEEIIATYVGVLSFSSQSQSVSEQLFSLMSDKKSTGVKKTIFSNSPFLSASNCLGLARLNANNKKYFEFCLKQAQLFQNDDAQLLGLMSLAGFLQSFTGEIDVLKVEALSFIESMLESPSKVLRRQSTLLLISLNSERIISNLDLFFEGQLLNYGQIDWSELSKDDENFYIQLLNKSALFSPKSYYEFVKKISISHPHLRIRNAAKKLVKTITSD